MDASVLLVPFLCLLVLAVPVALISPIVVSRRFSMLGDVAGHMAAPGAVASAALSARVGVEFGPLGAIASIILGFMVLRWLMLRRIESETAQGLVLVFFFSLAVIGMSVLPRLGIDPALVRRAFLGQFLALGWVEFASILFMALVLVFAHRKLHRLWILWAFDPEVLRLRSDKARLVEASFFLVLALLVTSLVYVSGILLVAAFLVIPGAVALLAPATIRTSFLRALGVSVVGLGVGGVLTATLPRVPAGPVMALSLVGVLVVVVLFRYPQGLLWRKWAARRFETRMRLENALKAIYLGLESGRAQGSFVISVFEFAAKRSITPVEARMQLDALCDQGFAYRSGNPAVYELSPTGLDRAQHVVRSHRLWELYLERYEGIPAHLVHAEAEFVEHELSIIDLLKLETLLGLPESDPHGRPIPMPGGPNPESNKPGGGQT